ncbi:MAG: putative membrane protein [Halobacteriales archaeon]|jgi:putative membrane protein
MLVVFCVDLDDDLGRKTGIETPVIGEEAVEEAAVALATADPEDSDVNVLFEGLHIARGVTGESVTVAAVTGNERGDVSANREVGQEVDEVLASLTTGENVRCIVVTDGAQDESVVPVIRSRVTIDGVRRVVVRQAQDLESMYYTIKQVLNDPETRGTILVPLGMLLLIYPLWVIVNALEVVNGALPAAVLGLASGVMGLYVLSRGIGLGSRIDAFADRARNLLYAGRATVITYVVALALLVIGGVSGVEYLQATQADVEGTLGGIEALAALLFGSVRWFAAAAFTTSVGQITDEYLADRLEWRYLNAPFYVVSIAGVLHTLSAYLLDIVMLSTLAGVLTAATLLALVSTLAFAIVESRYQRAEPA